MESSWGGWVGIALLVSGLLFHFFHIFRVRIVMR